jgi:hypothetical protein
MIITQTNNQEDVLERLHLLPNALYYTMETNTYVYFFLIHTNTGWNQIMLSTLPAQYPATSGHCEGNYIGAENVVVK